MKQRKRKPFEERLWSFIDKKGPDDCWLWTGGLSGKGYGSLRKDVDGNWVQTYAHREVLLQHQGTPADPNAHALHSCDNPQCCNPNHLSWGTNSQNRRQARDRLFNQGNQKLTPEQVEQIKLSSGTNVEIAAKFEVHFDTVARIRRGISWKP